MTRAAQTAAISRLPTPLIPLAAALATMLLACGCATGDAARSPTSKSSINGYKRQVKDGQELYCREDEVLGSRVKGKLICYTAIELAERQQAPDELLRQARGAVGETAAPRMDAPRF